MKRHECKVLMLLENCFPGDCRPRKEAQALINEGYKVSVIAINHGGEKFREIIDGVQVYRVPELTVFNKSNRMDSSYLMKLFGRLKSTLGYASEYLYFTSACLLMGLYVLFKDGFHVVHAHNPPDTLFIVGGFFKLFGKKFVFDHHDLSPELYLTRVSGEKNIVYKALVLCEKVTCKLANAIITVNESYKKIEIERHKIEANKIYIVRNNPIIDECTFQHHNNNINSTVKNGTKLLFLGSINPQDGVDLLIESLHYLKNNLNRRDFSCNIIGSGDSVKLVKQMTIDLDMTDSINFLGMIYDRDTIRKYLTLSDIGVEPASDNELNKHSTFIKVMEYMAASMPIVAFDLTETRYSTNSLALLVEPGNISGFANAIAKLMNEPELRSHLGRAGIERVRKELTWERAALNLIQAYKSLYS